MTDKIKKGDVVHLKSNNRLLMTVGYVSEDEGADCYWAIHYGETPEIKQAHLPVCALEIYNKK